MAPAEAGAFYCRAVTWASGTAIWVSLNRSLINKTVEFREAAAKTGQTQSAGRALSEP